MGSVLKPIQTLKEYISCHVYCAHLGTPWYQIVGGSRTISNMHCRALNVQINFPQPCRPTLEQVEQAIKFKFSLPENSTLEQVAQI